jgi:hypothetical protein
VAIEGEPVVKLDRIDREGDLIIKGDGKRKC